MILCRPRPICVEAPDAAQALLVLASIDEVTGDLVEAKDAYTLRGPAADYPI
jgi:hypothetical protein